MAANLDDHSPIISDIVDFDRGSGSLIERLLFNNRPVILLACLLATIFFGYQATKVQLNADFNKMIPTQQPYIVNFFKHYDELQSQGNAIRIAVQANNGTIINAHYLEMLKEINDKVYLMSNVDRAFMTSLWTPSTRWITVVSDGLSSGPVIGGSYDGSPAQLSIVAQNIANTGRVGELVSDDYTSSMMYVPLLQYDGITNQNLNYGELTKQLNQLRKEYASQGVTLHIIGFAMVVGDMINGIDKILIFFGISILIAAAMLFWFTRCVRSTLLVVTASLVAVIWQMGILPLLGYQLTPYSVLVPFLVFAIGMSHGAQKMNGVMQDIGRGAHPLVAARFTFRRLFLAGFSALVCDAASFAVLMTIHIEAIRELALLASIGVGILIFTNLIMLPLLLSFVGVNKQAALRSLRGEQAVEKHKLWQFLDLFTQRRYAAIAIAAACVLAATGLYVSRGLQVGDIHPGAPEFRADAPYNLDDAYFVGHYPTSSDVFIAMIKTPPGACADYHVLAGIDQLEQRLQRLPGVESTYSLSDLARTVSMGMNEGNWAWYDLLPNQPALNEAVPVAPPTLATEACDFMTLSIFLRDHKAATLAGVADTINNFSNTVHIPGMQVLMAAGNGGIAAATNQVVAQASRTMLLWVYAAVIALSLITFRSWRAVLAAILPLMLTSILAQALMVWLGIGVKVATLPVTALGVGIGVDYALYILTIVMSHMRRGVPLSEAYFRALVFTGKVVMLTGWTLAVAVGTWAFSPIKFQADMGILLAFMFLVNMLGAAILLPSLATFLIKPAHAAKSDVARA